MKSKLSLLSIFIVLAIPVAANAGSSRIKRSETGFKKVAQAHAVDFSEVKDFGFSEFECEYAHDSCDEFEMEKDLKAKCALDGFLSCETIERKRADLERGDDFFFCGQWHKGQCEVTVRGSNGESEETD